MATIPFSLRLIQPLLTATLMLIGLMSHAQAVPTDEMIHQLNSQVLRVQVGLQNGSYGLGSGVVVAKDQVVTNCHVVANATSVSVISNGASFSATGVKPDWKHDVCVLEVQGLDAAPVNTRASKSLKYEQAVFTIGYPGFMPIPHSSYGVVKGLFPMDDSVIIRATSEFRLGASGGGAFDDDGNLIGIITLKSPGKNAYYYFMPVEWMQALLDKPAQPIVVKSELPFWAKSADQWPYFMKVVQPYLTKDWEALKTVANQWVKAEPAANEAWFYLAAAEYAEHDLSNAEAHMRQVVGNNSQHSQAIYYLGLIAEANGQHSNALTEVALLSLLDADSAKALKAEIGQ
jgi:serine protease Do